MQPRQMAPAKAMNPPIEWTTVEPAKSWKPMPSEARKWSGVPIVTKNPSGPQHQWPTIG